MRGGLGGRRELEGGERERRPGSLGFFWERGDENRGRPIDEIGRAHV